MTGTLSQPSSHRAVAVGNLEPGYRWRLPHSDAAAANPVATGRHAASHAHLDSDPDAHGDIDPFADAHAHADGVAYAHTNAVGLSRRLGRRHHVRAQAVSAAA